jgi:hypothetical protein
MKDIHGIRPPVQFGLDPLLLKIILIVTGVIILFVLLFFLIKKYLKKRKPVTDLQHLSKPIAPYEAALKELDLLFQRQMVDPGLFYFDLTAVLRKYIGSSFGINAIEMTSQEFIKAINGLDFDRVQKKDITGFQKYCDPFKYAGIAPPRDRARQDLSFIKKIIQQIEKDLKKPDELKPGELKEGIK